MKPVRPQNIFTSWPQAAPERIAPECAYIEQMKRDLSDDVKKQWAYIEQMILNTRGGPKDRHG
jgi:hypothetical protein